MAALMHPLLSLARQIFSICFLTAFDCTLYFVQVLAVGKEASETYSKGQRVLFTDLHTQEVGGINRFTLTICLLEIATVNSLLFEGAVVVLLAASSYLDE